MLFVLLLSTCFLQVLINFIKFEVGVRCVSISPEGELVAAGCKNGEFIIMNFANLKIVSRKRDRNQTVQDIRQYLDMV